MAVRTVEELMQSVRDRIGEDTSDEALALIEDVNDTLSDFDSRTRDNTDWKTKYEENDKNWREKYRDRFYNTGTDNEPEELSDDADNTPKTFADLFK